MSEKDDLGWQKPQTLGAARAKFHYFVHKFGESFQRCLCREYRIWNNDGQHLQPDHNAPDKTSCGECARRWRMTYGTQKNEEPKYAPTKPWLPGSEAS